MKRRVSLKIALTVLFAVCLMVGTCALCLAVEDAPIFTVQPKDQVVSYPDSAEFSVEVADPDNVVSYQWYMRDIEDQIFELEGSTAKTNHLFIPSTYHRDNLLTFWCDVKLKDGSIHSSDEADLTKNNDDVDKPVLYISEYAVEPGESLDLATVDLGNGHKLGSGTVTFAANGTDITLDNVTIDNGHPVCWYCNAPSMCFNLERHLNEEEEYTVTLKGKNTLINRYYDPAYNASGMTMDFIFWGEETEVFPDVNFVGDGSLDITSGTVALRGFMCYFNIQSDITIRQNSTHYADGIEANGGIMIGKNVKLDLTVNGSGLTSAGLIEIKEGAEININALAPRVSVGSAVKILIQGGDLDINGAKINIIGTAKPEIYVPTNQDLMGYVGMVSGNMFTIRKSEINVELTALRSDQPYANGFIGLFGSSDIPMVIEDSTVNIDIDSADIYSSSAGMVVDGDLVIANSTLNINDYTSGDVCGMEVTGSLGLYEKTNVDIQTASADHGLVYGIQAGECKVDLAVGPYQVKAKATDGVAYISDIVDVGEEFKGYDSEYEATTLKFENSSYCKLPVNCVVSTTSHQAGEDYYQYFETIYDMNQLLRAPADQFVFVARETEHDWGTPTYTWNADNSEVTAKRVCKNDPTHVETETVKTTAEITSQATSSKSGTRTITAKFENNAFSTQTKVQRIPPTWEAIPYRIVIGEGAPNITSSNLADIAKALATEDDKTAAEDEGLSVWLEAALLAEKDVPTDAKDILAAKIKDLSGTAGTWFDLSLHKSLNGTVTDIGGTATPVKLTVTIPDALKKTGRTFYLLGIKDCKVTVISSGQGSSLSGDCDSFSVFVIAY